MRQAHEDATTKCTACGFALLGFPCLSEIPISQASGSSSVEGAALLAMVTVF